MSVRKLDRDSLDAVAALFAVLAEPTRLSILQELQGGPRTVSDLVASLGARQANISKQLGILFSAGLLHRERDGNSVRYAIGDPMVFDLCELVCRKLQRDAESRVRSLKRMKYARSPGA